MNKHISKGSKIKKNLIIRPGTGLHYKYQKCNWKIC